MAKKKEKVMFLDEATLHRYISNKIYYAKPMTRGEYNKERGWMIPENENPDDAGYVIMYPDGYISWSPAPQFEATSSRTDAMNFGMALVALKKGYKVARSGWNGKDMYVWLQEGTEITEDMARNSILRDCFVDRGGKITILPHLDMRTVRGEALIGWSATQTDMLSDDWFIVD